jgi:hypothetical protein
LKSLQSCFTLGASLSVYQEIVAWDVLVEGGMNEVKGRFGESLKGENQEIRFVDLGEFGKMIGE